MSSKSMVSGRTMNTLNTLKPLFSKYLDNSIYVLVSSCCVYTYWTNPQFLLYTAIFLLIISKTFVTDIFYEHIFCSVDEAYVLADMALCN